MNHGHTDAFDSLKNTLSSKDIGLKDNIKATCVSLDLMLTKKSSKKSQTAIENDITWTILPKIFSFTCLCLVGFEINNTYITMCNYVCQPIERQIWGKYIRQSRLNVECPMAWHPKKLDYPRCTDFKIYTCNE